VKDVTIEQQVKLNELLTTSDDSRQSWLDKLRKGPTRISSPALIQALQRIETVRALGISLPTVHVPQNRLDSLARFANTVKVSVIERLPPTRRLATLVAFVHNLEASTQDDALDVLDMLLRELFSKAKQSDRKARLRSLKDLDKSAITLADACRMVLNPKFSNAKLRSCIYATIGQ
jgi:hypothetical protein